MTVTRTGKQAVGPGRVASADPVEIEDALDAMLEPGQLIEIRTFDPVAKVSTFDDAGAAARYAATLSQSSGVYYVPNRFKHGSGKQGAAKDEDITERRYLLIDVDAVRADGHSGESATDGEKAEAFAVADAADEYIAACGFLGVVRADSGNGAHLMVPVSLPADKDSLDLHDAFLKHLTKFDTAGAKVDQSTKNASRVWKLPGTVARKGPNTLERPHRKVKLLSAPPDAPVGTPSHAETNTALLRRLAAGLVPESQATQARVSQPAAWQTVAGGSARVSRARTYLAKIDPGVSGQDGSIPMFRAACVLRDFGLTKEEAWPLMVEYSDRCLPPWTEKEIHHKLDDAYKKPANLSRFADGPAKAAFGGMITEASYRQMQAEAAQDEVGPDAAGDAAGEASADEADDAPATEGVVPMTDLGNAEELVRRHANYQRYVGVWRKWLTYRGTHWEVDYSGAVVRRARATVRKMQREALSLQDEKEKKLRLTHALRSEGAKPLQAMVSLAASLLPMPVGVGQLDADGMLLNCVNGTVDLRTGVLRPHRREDLITKVCPTPYLPDAKCPTFLSFLASIFPAGDAAEEPGDPEMIAFIQRFLGSCCAAKVVEHLVGIAYGVGANGKSTLFDTAQDVLGPDYSAQAPPELLMSAKGGRHPTERATLFGKRMAVVNETAEGGQLNEAQVKAVTGGDKITARRMKEDFWEFDPTHKLILCTNHLPRINGGDDGIWRRIRLVPFVVQFWNPDRPAKDGEARPDYLRQDKTLPDKLRAEAPGILAWMVEGCLMWQRDGLGMPPSVSEATDGYRAEQDLFTQFIAECCTRGGSEIRGRAGELYEAFQKYVAASGEKLDMGQIAFGKRVVGLPGVERKTSNGTWYWGIACNPK